MVRGLQSTDIEEQVVVMSSWSGTEKSTSLLLPRSHNSHQMRTTAWACPATDRTGSCWYWATGAWWRAEKQVPEPSLSQHLHSCPVELPSLVYGLSPAHLWKKQSKLQVRFDQWNENLLDGFCYSSGTIKSHLEGTQTWPIQFSRGSTERNLQARKCFHS